MYKESTVPLHRRPSLDIISGDRKKGKTPVESSRTKCTAPLPKEVIAVLDLITTKKG